MIGYILNNLRPALIRRMNRHKIITEDNHWLWNGAKGRDGYGMISFLGKVYGVHRLSAILWLSDFKPELLALHKPECHTPACWNPEHLYQGTQLNNMRDRVINETSTKQMYCKRGHELTEENVIYLKKSNNGGRNCKLCIAIRNKKQIRINGKYVGYRK